MIRRPSIAGFASLVVALALVAGAQGALYVNQTASHYQNYTFNRTDAGAYFMNTSFVLSTKKHNLDIYSLANAQIEPADGYQVYTVVFGVFPGAAPTLINQTFNGVTSNWTLYPNSTNGTHSNYTGWRTVRNLFFTHVAVMDWVNTNPDADFLNYRLVVPVVATPGAPNAHGSPNGFLNFLYNVSATGGPNGYVGYSLNKRFVAQSLTAFPIDITGATVAPSTTSSANITGIPADALFHYNVLSASRNYGPFPYVASVYYEDYYINRLSYNWPFWFAVGLVLGFMLIANYLDDLVDYDDRLRNNWLTFYPFYSLYHCASEVIFTRRIRLAIFTLRLASMGWFNALMVYRYIQVWGQPDVNWAMRLALFPACAAVFSLFWWLFAGVLANLYYATHRRYVDNLKTIEDLNAREAELERYEEDSFSKLHIFYFFIIIFGGFFIVFPIWALWWHTLENQGYWLLQMLISFGWSLLVFEPLFALLGRAAFLAPLIRLGGYWFDYDLHEEFKLVYKIA